MLPYLAGAAGPPPLAPQAAAASSSGNRSTPGAAPTAGAPAGAAAAQRHRALAEWVWAYYSQGRASAAAGPAPTAVAAAAAAGGGGSSSSCVGITQRGPLYLQHEGHSRTVVGIERVAPPGQTAEYSLLLLDPGLGNDELLGSLRSGRGWQRRVKRSMASLGRHAEYQLLWVGDDLVPVGPQRDALKTIAAEEVYR